jgi:diguanylate cyclase (GGDEF)-like protein
MKEIVQAVGMIGQGAPEATVEGLAKARQRQLRVLLTFTGSGILAIAAIMLLAGHLLIQRFEQIEHNDALQKAAQLLHAAAADFRQLSITNRNNAEWDDAADFVATHNQAFIHSNFTAMTMDGLHADLAWIIDRDGHSLYSGLYDRASRTLVTPAPAELLDQLQTFLRTPRAPAGGAAAAQVVRTSLGPMAVSDVEITRTDRYNPTGASMVLTRRLGAAEIARIGDTSQLPVSLSLLRDLSAPPVGMNAAVFHWARDPKAAATMASVIDRNAILSYALIRDFEGTPVAVLSAPLSRDIYTLGLHTTAWLLGSISTVLIVFSAAILVLVLRLQSTFAAQEAAQHRLRRLTKQMQDMVVLADPNDLRVLDANDAILRKMNCDLSELRTRRVGDLYPAFAAGNVDPKSLDVEGSFLQATTLVTGAELPLLADVTVTRLQESDRQYLCFVGTDVTHRRQVDDLQRQNRRDLSHMAQHDALTGLPNRLYLQTRLRRTLRAALVNIQLNAVYYLNLDNFKLVNESHGQGVGDLTLQVIARRLRAAAETHALVARIGGDEFAVVVPQLPDMAAVDALADKLQTVLQAPIVFDGETLSVSASIGIALFPDHGNDMPTVLKHAEIAMQYAKQAGQHCHKLFSLDMNLRIQGRTNLLQSLKDALGTAQFHMEYQPIFDMKSGRLASLEALARWEHPELGNIPPETFILAAEKGNEMLALGTQLFELVFSDLRQWQQKMASIVPVSINLSPQQLERSDFADLVAQYCLESGVEQRLVGFELPESVFLHDLERVTHTLQQLRSRGSRIAINDFGTGSSNLSRLDKLPVDALKIRRAFVHEVSGSATRVPIVRAVIEMAHSLQLTTVAVGVETVQELALLTEQGCDFAQGYFLGRPLLAGQCQELLAQLQGDRTSSQSILRQAVSDG